MQAYLQPIYVFFKNFAITLLVLTQSTARIVSSEIVQSFSSSATSSSARIHRSTRPRAIYGILNRVQVPYRVTLFQEITMPYIYPIDSCGNQFYFKGKSIEYDSIVYNYFDGEKMHDVAGDDLCHEIAMSSDQSYIPEGLHGAAMLGNALARITTSKSYVQPRNYSIFDQYFCRKDRISTQLFVAKDAETLKCKIEALKERAQDWKQDASYWRNRKQGAISSVEISKVEPVEAQHMFIVLHCDDNGNYKARFLDLCQGYNARPFARYPHPAQSKGVLGTIALHGKYGSVHSITYCRNPNYAFIVQKSFHDDRVTITRVGPQKVFSS